MDISWDLHPHPFDPNIFNRLFFLNITPLFAMGYISEVKLQVTIQ